MCSPCHLSTLHQVLDRDEQNPQAAELLAHAHQRSLIGHFANQASDAAARWLIVNHPTAAEHIQPVARKAILGADTISADKSNLR